MFVSEWDDVPADHQPRQTLPCLFWLLSAATTTTTFVATVS